MVISIQKEPKNKTGWTIKSRLSISLHKKDIALLQQIQAYFGGVGSIVDQRDGTCQYVVTSIEEITTKILLRFDNYPLITQKLADYFLFKMAVNLIKSKKHLTPEGLNEIVSIRASLNLGLTPALKIAFPDITPVSRPLVEDKRISDLYWIAGFTSGGRLFPYRGKQI